MSPLVDGTGSPRPSAAPAGEARLLRTLFDQLPALIAYWDKDRRNVVANEAYVEWFGFTPRQMLGIHIREVLGERVYAMNLPYIEGALAGHEQLFDRTLVDQLGRTRHTQASYVPDIVDGEVRGFFVLVTDVTPRVEAQRAMDQAQAMAQLGSWSLAIPTGTVTWSEELYRIFDLDPATYPLDPASLFDLVHPEDRDHARRVSEEARRDGRDYVSRYRIVRPSGEVREVETRGSVVLGEDGTPLRAAGTVQDITEVNEAARELARVNAELMRLNQINADVIGMLGHDVRAPLAVILGYLEELDENWEEFSEGARREMIGMMRGSARRAGRLVDGILALAAADSGTIRTSPTRLEVETVLAEVLADLPQGKEVAPSVTEPGLTVSADPIHLRQILTNLISNALRYGAPPVRVSVAREGDGVAFTVVDDGNGVPAVLVPQLFERFVDSGESQRLRGGTGLGLYLVRELARANSGTVEYRPRDAEDGPRFVVGLPG